jgi:hypothetical protein
MQSVQLSNNPQQSGASAVADGASAGTNRSTLLPIMGMNSTGMNSMCMNSMATNVTVGGLLRFSHP